MFFVVGNCQGKTKNITTSILLRVEEPEEYLLCSLRCLLQPHKMIDSFKTLGLGPLRCICHIQLSQGQVIAKGAPQHCVETRSFSFRQHRKESTKDSGTAPTSQIELSPSKTK